MPEGLRNAQVRANNQESRCPIQPPGPCCNSQAELRRSGTRMLHLPFPGAGFPLPHYARGLADLLPGLYVP